MKQMPQYGPSPNGKRLAAKGRKVRVFMAFALCFMLQI